MNLSWLLILSHARLKTLHVGSSQEDESHISRCTCCCVAKDSNRRNEQRVVAAVRGVSREVLSSF